jgi:hypothetical protein
MNEVGTRRLRDALHLADDGRTIFHWRGSDLAEDTNRLADAIAESVKLFNHDGALVRLDDGRLVPVNRAALRDLITQHICAVRLIERDGIWCEDYFTYAFEPQPRPDPMLAGRNLPPQPPPSRSLGPDDKVLMQLHQHELPKRVPEVLTSAS